jgi:hypothetical protein
MRIGTLLHIYKSTYGRAAGHVSQQQSIGAPQSITKRGIFETKMEYSSDPQAVCKTAFGLPS